MASFVLYRKALGFPFSAYDDPWYVTTNPIIQDLSVRNLQAMLVVQILGNYAPVHIFAYAVEFRLWGLWSPGYHAVNIALHGVNAYLVLAVCLRLGIKRPAAVLTGLIFLAHPVHVESVVWISELKTLMAAAFFLGSLIFYMRSLERAPWGFYIASLLFFVAACLSKASAVALPLLLAAYHWFLGKQEWRGSIARLIPFLLVSLLTSWLATGSQTFDTWGAWAWQGRLASVWSSTGVIGLEYIRHLLFPFNLSPYYYMVPEEVSRLSKTFSAGVLILLLILAAQRLSARKIEGFLSAWFFLMILPNANLFPLDVLMADRYLYIPAIGLCALVSIGVTRLWKAEILRTRIRVVSLLVATTIGIFALRTWQESLEWREDRTLYRSIVRNNPSPKILTLLAEVTPEDPSGGEAESREAIAARAFETINRELARTPANPELYETLGRAYIAVGKRDEAKEALTKAMELNPHSELILERLAGLYMWPDKNFHAALPLIERALRLSTYRLRPRIQLVQAQAALGNYDAARRAAEAITQQWPNDPIGVALLADIYKVTGNTERSIILYRRLIEMEPGSERAQDAAAAIESMQRVR